MRLAVISDIHVLGPGEAERLQRIALDLGARHSFLARKWNRALLRIRRRLWNWHPQFRETVFLKALDDIARFDADRIVAVGDYGGDAAGVGVSDDASFESVRRVTDLLRATFPDRCRFVIGDHELGKHSTELRRGGIRLESLRRCVENLGMPAWWMERVGPFHLIGLTSTLLALDLFLPEALAAEAPAWRQWRERQRDWLRATFSDLPGDARVLLFLHEPSALSFLDEIPEARARLPQIERTVLGHLHAPGLLPWLRLLARLPRLNPRYPIMRIISHGARGAHRWTAFRPVVCPAVFGAGHHFSGGVLFFETDPTGRLHVRRHRLPG